MAAIRLSRQGDSGLRTEVGQAELPGSAPHSSCLIRQGDSERTGGE